MTPADRLAQAEAALDAFTERHFPARLQAEERERDMPTLFDLEHAA